VNIAVVEPDVWIDQQVFVPFAAPGRDLYAMTIPGQAIGKMAADKTGAPKDNDALGVTNNKGLLS